MSYITIRAGENIIESIRDGGLSFDDIAAVVGPAAGPRWLLASGFDRALTGAGVLGLRRPVTLVGSSAGALRFAAWMQPEPEKAYLRLMDAYSIMTFSREDTPLSIQETLARVIDHYLEDDALPFALANKRFRLSVMTARARHGAASDSKWLQMPALVAAGLLNALHPSCLSLFFQPVVFYSGFLPPPFCRNGAFPGLAIPMTVENCKRALLASSAVPLAVAGVRNVFGAPRGVYRDGGLVDYHGNHDNGAGSDGVALLFHHQKRLVPTWLDRFLTARTLPKAWTGNLLVITPSQSFIDGLPDGRIPDRRDFRTFVDQPEERIRRWRKTAEAAAVLGEAFLESVAGGGIRQTVQKLELQEE